MAPIVWVRSLTGCHIASCHLRACQSTCGGKGLMQDGQQWPCWPQGDVTTAYVLRFQSCPGACDDMPRLAWHHRIQQFWSMRQGSSSQGCTRIPQAMKVACLMGWLFGSSHLSEHLHKARQLWRCLLCELPVETSTPQATLKQHQSSPLQMGAATQPDCLTSYSH